MGQSTDALLYFGFDFCNTDEDDEVELEFEPGDWEEYYAKKHGIVDDSERYTEEGEYAKCSPEEAKIREKKWNAWIDKKYKLIEKLPFDIDSHCSGDYPIYFVCLKKYTLKANRGYPKKVDVESLTKVSLAEIAKMQTFCEEMGIPWKEPEWHLASYWG